MLPISSSHLHQFTIETFIVVLTVLTVNSTIINNNSIGGSTVNSDDNNSLNSRTRSTSGNAQTTDNPTNNNQNQSFIMELRERKRKERLSIIKSSILSQLSGNLLNGHQHHHNHNRQHDTKVDPNSPCYLNKAERDIMSDIFMMIKKTPEGTIDVNQFETNQQIIEKVQGLSVNSWACVRTAILTSTSHQRNQNTTLAIHSNHFPINSSSSLGNHLFDQSNLSNKSLSDYQNDNATQQLMQEHRQRRKQERLMIIQQQILSRLGLTQRANDTLPPCKLTDNERALIDQVISGKSSSESNQLTQLNIVFTKLQGFYTSCKLNLDTIQSNNSIPS